MNNAMPVRFGQTRAYLESYSKTLLLWHRPSAQPLGKGFPFQKLHADEIDFALRTRSCMNLKQPAHVWVADLASIPNLGRQLLTEARLRKLNRDPPLQPLIEGLPDNAHPATCYLPDNTKTAYQQLPWFERTIRLGRRTKRIQQKARHAFFPLHIVPDPAKQFGVAFTCPVEIVLAFTLRTSQSSFHQAHCELVRLRDLLHDRLPPARISRWRDPATFVAWSEVCPPSLRQASPLLASNSPYIRTS